MAPLPIPPPPLGPPPPWADLCGYPPPPMAGSHAPPPPPPPEDLPAARPTAFKTAPPMNIRGTVAKTLGTNVWPPPAAVQHAQASRSAAELFARAEALAATSPEAPRRRRKRRHSPAAPAASTRHRHRSPAAPATGAGTPAAPATGATTAAGTRVTGIAPGSSRHRHRVRRCRTIMIESSSRSASPGLAGPVTGIAPSRSASPGPSPSWDDLRCQFDGYLAQMRIFLGS